RCRGAGRPADRRRLDAETGNKGGGRQRCPVAASNSADRVPGPQGAGTAAEPEGTGRIPESDGEGVPTDIRQRPTGYCPHGRYLPPTAQGAIAPGAALSPAGPRGRRYWQMGPGVLLRTAPVPERHAI